MNAIIHPEHVPSSFAWAAALRDDASREWLTDEDFEFGCLMAELNAAGVIRWWDARGMIALHCAPLRLPAPHTAWTAVGHHHGLQRSLDRAAARHRTVLEALERLFGLAVPLAIREHRAAEERFRRAAGGALLRRQSTREAGQAGCAAAEFLIVGDRMEALLAEEAAFWLRRRSEA